MQHRIPSIIVTALIFAGCGKSSPESSTADLSLTDAQRAECVVTGEQVSTLLMKGLGSQLKAALSGGDPAAAVHVCQQVAQPVTASTAGKFPGVTVSRTSLKFRNPVNAPKEADRVILEKWQILADGGKTLPEHEVVQVDATTATYYRPIMVQEVCIKCHGAAQALSPALTEVLETLYPDDRAKGYEVGDFRGAFRVTIDLTAAEQRRDETL